MDRVASTYLKAACTLIGLSGPLPGPIRRQSLRKHLEHVSRYIYNLGFNPLTLTFVVRENFSSVCCCGFRGACARACLDLAFIYMFIHIYGNMYVCVCVAYLKAACTLIGLSGPLLGPIRRQSLRKHLEHVRVYMNMCVNRHIHRSIYLYR